MSLLLLFAGSGAEPAVLLTSHGETARVEFRDKRAYKPKPDRHVAVRHRDKRAAISVKSPDVDS